MEAQEPKVVQSFSMRLPVKLHRQLRILAIQRGTSLTKLLERGAYQVLREETEAQG